jgi:hypothetical protein
MRFESPIRVDPSKIRLNPLEFAWAGSSERRTDTENDGGLKANPKRIPSESQANPAPPGCAFSRTNQVPAERLPSAYNRQSCCQAATRAGTVFWSEVTGKYLAGDGWQRRPKTALR